MIIESKSGDLEATPKNAIIITGDNLINGLYVDNDDDYLFVPDDPEIVPFYQELKEQGIAEGITVCEVLSYDPEAQPFCFIINALCRVFREEVEIRTNEN